ncbi:MAG: TonB-dependent receptor plug domain-containing protein [Bacteroidota bacterium]
MKFINLLSKVILSLGIIIYTHSNSLARISASYFYEQQEPASIKVSGTIFDENDMPLPGVSVLVKGTTQGTVTDIDGKFTLEVEVGSILRISFIGYKTEEITVEQATTLNINLIPDIIALEGIVVIGYGTQKKADLTSAISVVETEDIENIATTNIADAIQGSASGVTVRATGRPDGEAQIQIRGIGNIGNNNPLYIIDGLPTSGGKNFNVNDVASIQILKDAAAASIYGSRAANGVIIITTKKGKSGEVKAEYSGNMSVQWMPRYDLTNRDEYIYLNDMSRINVGKVTQGHFDGTKWAGMKTDWQDVFFKPGIINDHNMSFSGGDDNGNYFKIRDQKCWLYLVRVSLLDLFTGTGSGT